MLADKVWMVKQWGGGNRRYGSCFAPFGRKAQKPLVYAVYGVCGVCEQWLGRSSDPNVWFS